MIRINESKSYHQKEFSLSTWDLKKMKVGSEIHSRDKHARKIGPDEWELDDRIDKLKFSSSKIEDIFEFEENVDIMEA